MFRLSRSSQKPFRAIIAAMACSSMVVLSGCTIDNAGGQQASNSDKSAQTKEGKKDQSEAENIKPVASVKDGQTEVDVLEPVMVKSGERLTKVEMTNAQGEPVQGEFDSDHKSWKTTEELGYGTTYTLDAKSGKNSTTTSFTTIQPQYVYSGAMQPLDGATVGVGQPIGIRFDGIIGDRKAVQDAITVKTEPPVEGAFYWITAQELRWRPEKFWKPGTKVTVDAKLYGLDLGNGAYGQEDRHASFTIGDSVIAEIDDNTKTMVVKRNGEVEKTMPVSLGSAQHPTPNGVYFLGDHNPSMIMDSATFGLTGAGAYRETIQNATQMSYSGVYVHSAPWSVAQQGSANVSHGCVNVSPDNARWFLQNTKRGDIVEVKNTVGSKLNGSDGLGDWNIPWSTWKAGNVDS